MIKEILENDAIMMIVLAAALIGASILLLNWVFQPTMDGIDWREDVYTVEGGDSLWELSGKYCPDTVDRREWIDEVQALNGMQSSTIYAGQKIIILEPVKEG